MAQAGRNYEFKPRRSSSTSSSIFNRRSTPNLAQTKIDHNDGLAPPSRINSAATDGGSGPYQVYGDSVQSQNRNPDDMLAASDAYHDFVNLATRCPPQPQITSKTPFKKLVQRLHRRQQGRQPTASCPETHSQEDSAHRRLSSSISSFAFVSSVREASMSLASASIMRPSRKQPWRSSHTQSRTDRSSRTSARHSEDSHGYDRQLLVDPIVIERSLHRRRVLEELVRTEEGYIGDVRFLMNTYATILASLPSIQAGLRSSINRNLSDIVELHEKLLGDLHRVIPDSEYTQVEIKRTAEAPIVRQHRRWKSLDAVTENRNGATWLQHMPGMTAEPQVAAEVAKVFIAKMNRFFIYEEYGAKYELMFKDLEAAFRSIPHWDEYQRGLETLGSCVGSTKQSKDSRRALTISDLLAKPIQRVCKYPLLFSELLKYTPVCDCPYSYMEIDNALARLREVTGAMNKATDDVTIKATLEKTWLLQDRLSFPNSQLDAISKSHIRSLGHIQLCGVLHVCWQTKDSVSGRYMICLLYRDWLCLAVADKTDHIYTIQACVPLNTCNLESADNDRGLQCHTAPYSWKLVFECDFQLYEIIMTACTPKEEWEWRRRLDRKVDDSRTQPEIQDSSFLALNIKTLGTVFGKPDTFARRVSIRRATTVGAKPVICQVIVKNTSVDRERPPFSSKEASISRSRSLETNARIPVLAPSRADRARLEALTSDVWTREVLPFPGMAGRARSERLILSSASVIRKLSVASLASTFGRRSGGRASTQHLGDLNWPEGPENSVVQSHSSLNRTLDESSSVDNKWSSDEVEIDADLATTTLCWAGLPNAAAEKDKHVACENHCQDAETSETNTLASSIRRTVTRLFEDSSQHRPRGKERRRASSTSKHRASPAPHESSRTQSLHCVHLATAASDSTVKLSQYNSIYETMKPLARQPARTVSAKSLRRWSKARIFHRGALSQACGNRIH